MSIAETLVAIAKKLTSISKKLVTITENQQKIYDAGKQAEYTMMWDNLQEYGEREGYGSTFAQGWTDENFNPKYTIKCGSSAHGIFMNNSYLTEINCDIDMTLTTNTNSAFYGMSALTKIQKIIVSENTVYHAAMFSYCRILAEVFFEGVIANTFTLSWSVISADSLRSIISCLKNFYKEDPDKVDTCKLSVAAGSWDNLEATGPAPDGGKWRDYVISLGWTI